MDGVHEINQSAWEESGEHVAVAEEVVRDFEGGGLGGVSAGSGDIGGQVLGEQRNKREGARPE